MAYDPCYHQACDTVANVNVTAIDQMSDAVAVAAFTFAQHTGFDRVPGSTHKPKTAAITGPQAAA